jgi:PiT family inorganic phosphate transporter
MGTYLGGWRIIRTLGKGLVEISSPQGLAAESSSAAVILASSHLGFALSTTHVATGSILGTGLGRPGAVVRWGVAGRMLVAWCITIPSAALVGATMWWVGRMFDGIAGGAVITLILVALAGYMFMRSRRTPVGAHNVNEEWADDRQPATASTNA